MIAAEPESAEKTRWVLAERDALQRRNAEEVSDGR
jgi:hypothetical protein